MSGSWSGNFETRNRFAGSKLVLLAQPSDDVLDQVGDLAHDLRRRHGLTGELRPNDVLHVSLAGFGPYAMIPFAQVNALRHILSQLEFDAFDIAFDCVTSFHGSYTYPVVLYSEGGNEPLMELEKSVQVLLEPYFGKPAHRRYTPHMTLLYDRRKIATEKTDAVVRWRVNELVLVESLQGRTEYRRICSFPCRHQQPAAHWQSLGNEALSSAAVMPS